MRHLSMVVLPALISAAFAPATAFGAEPSAAQTTAKANDSPLAIVLEKPIYLQDLHPDETDKTALRDYRAIADPIVGPLLAKYAKEHRITATPLEIKNYRKWVDSRPNPNREPVEEKLTPEDEQALDEIDKFFVENWKFNKSLYEKYGGRVIFQQVGLEALEACQRWLRDEEKAGNFKIIDPKWRDAFWEYYKPKYHVFDDETNPFQTPPWEKPK